MPYSIWLSKVVVVADDIDGSTMSAVCDCVKGEIISVEEIRNLTDTKLIQKVQYA
jgi:hypothetical protein